MAKKQKPRVVIDQDYLAVLQAKSEMLDDIFEDGDTVRVNKASFKEYDKLYKAFNKVDINEEPYQGSG